MNLEKELFKLQDKKYKEFHSGLCPGVDNIIGVRVPVQRKLAKEMLKGNWQEFLDGPMGTYAEEKVIYGLVAATAPMDYKTRLKYIKKFVAKIDSWAVCDIVCASIKDAQKYQKEYWDFLLGYFQSKKEYHIRFAVVMLLDHYVNEKYIGKVLKELDKVRHEGYYVKMAVAWAISICYVKFPKDTMKFLLKTKIDDWTYNKALQKCRESFRVSKEDKIKLMKMKR